MAVKKVVKPNRAKRLHSLLKNRPCSSMEIIQMIGTVTPSKCVSELRNCGVTVKRRIAKDGSGVNEFYLPRR